jgi:hypothetical protein
MAFRKCAAAVGGCLTLHGRFRTKPSLLLTRAMALEMVLAMAIDSLPWSSRARGLSPNPSFERARSAAVARFAGRRPWRTAQLMIR